jgi:hypothetical protein
LNPDRDAWTAYAERAGLVRSLQPVVTNTPKPNKYHAIPVHVDGVRFASKKEAARYLELRLWEKAGQIAELERQPVYPLHILELWRSSAPLVITTVGKYTADFRYLNLVTGEYVVEDVKSEATRTRDYRLRKTIAEAIHGITIVEV